MPRFERVGINAPTLEARKTFIPPRLAADPGAPADGEVWYNTVDDVLRVRANGITVDLGTGAGGDAALLQGENGAFYLARANHTGTQVAATISDFQAAARAAITIADTATLNLTYAAGQISGDVLDAPTLQGSNLAAVIAAAVAAVVDTAPGTLDTLNELAAALGDDPNFAATMAALIATKARTFVADLAGGAATENVDHNLNTADLIATVYLKTAADAARPDEGYIFQRTTANRVVVVSEDGNIPANRRVVIIAVGA